MGRRTGIDVAMIVVSALMLVLTICLFAVVGAMLNLEYLLGIASTIQFGVAAWYLLTSLLGITSGASGHKCPYVSVILLSVLAILIALAACVLAALIAFTHLFEDISAIQGLFTTTPEYYKLEGVIGTSSYSEEAQEIISSLPIGVMIINGISFIMLIVLSAIACCGTCCNGNRLPAQPHATYITTSGGYTATATVPPAYVGQPPQHNFQGMSNPNYDTPDAGIALTDRVA